MRWKVMSEKTWGGEKVEERQEGKWRGLVK
jgi:hypothetical protein